MKQDCLSNRRLSLFVPTGKSRTSQAECRPQKRLRGIVGHGFGGRGEQVTEEGSRQNDVERSRVFYYRFQNVGDVLHIDGYKRIIFVDVGDDFSPEFRRGEFVGFVGKCKSAAGVVCDVVGNACGAFDFKFAVSFYVIGFTAERGVVRKAFFRLRICRRFCLELCNTSGLHCRYCVIKL